LLRRIVGDRRVVGDPDAAAGTYPRAL